MAIRLAVCCLQIAAVQAQNQELQACVSEIERHKATMTHQMFTLREKWTEATEENVKLRDEVASLRQHLQVHCTVWFVLLEIYVCTSQGVVHGLFSNTPNMPSFQKPWQALVDICKLWLLDH